MRERSPIALALSVAIALAVIVHGGRWANHWLASRHERQVESTRMAAWRGLEETLGRTPLLPGMTWCASFADDYCWSGVVPAERATGALVARLQAVGVRELVARCVTAKPRVVFCDVVATHSSLRVVCSTGPDWQQPATGTAPRRSRLGCGPSLLGDGPPPFPRRWRPLPIPTP